MTSTNVRDTNVGLHKNENDEESVPKEVLPTIPKSPPWGQRVCAWKGQRRVAYIATFSLGVSACLEEELHNVSVAVNWRVTKGGEAILPLWKQWRER